ncbi:MAG: hypothetical protein ABI347_02165 [Nitrososphaera sp.]|jgi:hypothetical protein
MALLFAPVPAHFQDALANECRPDKDWPERPCPDPETQKDELVRMWDKYYELKGKSWMDLKKAEMDKAIQDGTFGNWIDDPIEGPANKNVYMYYQLHGQVPNMVLDPSGNYVIQGSQPPQGEWYTTSIVVTAIAAIVAVAAVGSFFAYKKALRK